MTTRSDHAVELGYQGEQAVAELIRQRGWEVEPDLEGDADLIVEDFATVEVKTALPGKGAHGRGKRYQFCLYSHPERQQPVNEDILILRCEGKKPVHFIIPVSLIDPKLTKIDITKELARSYRGRWTVFREAWYLFDLMVAGLLYFNMISTQLTGGHYDRSEPT